MYLNSCFVYYFTIVDKVDKYVSKFTEKRQTTLTTGFTSQPKKFAIFSWKEQIDWS